MPSHRCSGLPECARRASDERAFTLIELLVVMIIIAILMAIAVPTFLAQKSNAKKTQAIENIQAMQHAIEACAVNNTDGTYTGCSEHTDIWNYEKSLKDIPMCCPSGVKVGSYDLNGIVVGEVRRAIPIAGEAVYGYELITWVKDGDKNIWIQLVHWEDGTVTKRCGEGLSFPAMNKSSYPGVSGSRICATGSW